MENHSRKAALAALAAVAAGSVAPLHHALAMEAYLSTTQAPAAKDRTSDQERHAATVDLISGICLVLAGAGTAISSLDTGLTVAAAGTSTISVAGQELTRLARHEREVAVRMAKEDANAFIANGYRNPSAHLSQIFQGVKEQMKELKGEAYANGLSDEEITDIILRME